MRTGTGSGRRQSAVIVPVPGAEAILASWRRAHDPVAPTDLPAHVTLVVPWLAPEAISDGRIDELGELLEGVAAFDFTLARVGRFGHRVLWLAPEPADSFRSLTTLVADHFATPPYDGDFGEVVPHLTVAVAATGAVAPEGTETLDAELPLACVAEEVWVMVGDGRTWELRARLPLVSA